MSILETINDVGLLLKGTGADIILIFTLFFATIAAILKAGSWMDSHLEFRANSSDQESAEDHSTYNPIRTPPHRKPGFFRYRATNKKAR